MSATGEIKKRRSIFKRSRLALPLRKHSTAQQAQAELQVEQSQFESNDSTVLVINDGREMAREITMQLTLGMPGCSIMYAPTLELARWILARREIRLVVSSPVLPDGSVVKLNSSLAQLENPPDVVVVGNVDRSTAKVFGRNGYQCSTYRNLGKGKEQDESTPPAAPQRLGETVRTLGADIRNDLNNPLQEIVAMVFVAQATGDVSNPTQQALEAIDQAAKNMSEYVNALEDKIRKAVS